MLTVQRSNDMTGRQKKSIDSVIVKTNTHQTNTWCGVACVSCYGCAKWSVKSGKSGKMRLYIQYVYVLKFPNTFSALSTLLSVSVLFAWRKMWFQAYRDPMLKLSIMTELELNQIFGTLDSLIPLHEGEQKWMLTY